VLFQYGIDVYCFIFSLQTSAWQCLGSYLQCLSTAGFMMQEWQQIRQPFKGISTLHNWLLFYYVCSLLKDLSCLQKCILTDECLCLKGRI
jgi:hypothetical protein